MPSGSTMPGATARPPARPRLGRIRDGGIGGLAGVALEAERRGDVERSARVSLIRTAAAPSARAHCATSSPIGPAPTTSTPLPATSPRRTACSATDVGSTSAAARASQIDPVRERGREHHPRRHRPVHVHDPGLRAPRAQVRPAGAAAHADAAADRHLPHDAVAGREAVDAGADVHHHAGPLVPGDDRVLREPHPEVGERALEDLDVGAADPHRRRRDQQLALARGRVGPLDDLEPFVTVELDCAH